MVARRRGSTGRQNTNAGCEEMGMVAEDQVAMLRAVPLFEHVRLQDLQALATRLRRRTFRRGEVIIHRGDPAGAMHVLKSGRVKITLPSSEGDETVLALLSAG